MLTIHDVYGVYLFLINVSVEESPSLLLHELNIIILVAKLLFLTTEF